MEIIIGLIIAGVAVNYQEIKKPEKPVIESQSERILSCVDRYRGEGIKKAYAICKDVHTLE